MKLELIVDMVLLARSKCHRPTHEKISMLETQPALMNYMSHEEYGYMKIDMTSYDVKIHYE